MPGDLLVRYVYSPADGRLILRDSTYVHYGPGGISVPRLYALTEPDGTITAIATPAGQVIERYVYTPALDRYRRADVIASRRPEYDLLRPVLAVDPVTFEINSAGTGRHVGSYRWSMLHRGGRYDIAGDTFQLGTQEFDLFTNTWRDRDGAAISRLQSAQIRAEGQKYAQRTATITAAMHISAAVPALLGSAALLATGNPLGAAGFALALTGISAALHTEVNLLDGMGFGESVRRGLGTATGYDTATDPTQSTLTRTLAGLQLFGNVAAAARIAAPFASVGWTRFVQAGDQTTAWLIQGGGRLMPQLVGGAGTVAAQAASAATRTGGDWSWLGNAGGGFSRSAAALGGINALAVFAKSSTSGNSTAAQTGLSKHKTYYADADGYNINQAIGNGSNLRPDAWKIVLDAARTPIGVIIRELKPNVARAIARGWRQLDRYEEAIKNAFPLLKDIPFLKGIDTY